MLKPSPSAIGQKKFDSQSEKSEMLKKSNDKNRFILIKEIVEKK